jgi:hypothetical protein
MPETHFIGWEPEPDVQGIAAAIAGPSGELLAEAAITYRDDGSAVYDVFDEEGNVVVAGREVASVAAAVPAAEDTLRRLVIRVV